MKINKIVKHSLLAVIFLFFILSCEKQKSNGFDSAQKSIKFTLENFPMIDKNLEKIKEVNLDSISISLYKNPKKIDYDEVIVFRKNKKYFAIPFFSNMYFDYWHFNNETQKQLYPKTNTTFEKQLKSVIIELNLSGKEFDLLKNELMNSVLNAESNLYLKPKLFENYIYMTYRVDKYKIDESDSCKKRTQNVFNEILNESKKTFQYNQFLLDSKNGRVYEFINDSRKKGELKFRIKTYRIDCFFYPLNI